MGGSTCGKLDQESDGLFKPIRLTLLLLACVMWVFLVNVNCRKDWTTNKFETMIAEKNLSFIYLPMHLVHLTVLTSPTVFYDLIS